MRSLGMAFVLATGGWIAVGAGMVSADIAPLGFIPQERAAADYSKVFGKATYTTLIFCRGALDDANGAHHGCPQRAGWFYVVGYQDGQKVLVNAHSGWSSLDPPPSAS